MEGIRTDRRGDRTEIRLAGRLSISDTPQVRREFEAALARGRDIDLDGSEVTGLDTAAVQLLALFCRAVRNKGLTARWQGASHVLHQTVALLGMNAVLGLPETPDVTHH